MLLNLQQKVVMMYLNLLHIYPIQFRNTICSFEMDRFSAKSTCIFPERKAWENSKGKRVSISYLAPNSCIPSKANMNMNSKSKNIRLSIERTLLRSDVTRLRKDFQNLTTKKR